MLGVITSYSIHYTKLYEKILIETRNVDPDESVARDHQAIPADARVELLFRDNGTGMDSYNFV